MNPTRPHPAPLPRRRFLALLGGATLALPGCARVPTAGGTNTGRLLRVTFRVRGQIQPTNATLPYYYFVLINLTNNLSDPGPVPVVALPPGGGSTWGNGFAAASQPNAQGFVGFVSYDSVQGYQVRVCPGDGNGGYRHGGDVLLTEFTNLGLPDSFVVPQAGDATLDFRLDLNRLKLKSTDTLPTYAQINIVATNNIPVGATDVTKYWDALGNGGNTGELNAYVGFSIAQSGQTIINANTNFPEPANDVRDRLGPLVNEPNLDIIDWTIQTL